MTPVLEVAQPPLRPVLIYDGDCGFCRRWILRWRAWTGEQIEYVPFQAERVAGQFPELPRAQLEKSVHLVDGDGRVYRGAEAVFRSLAGVRRWPLRWYQHVPGAAWLSEAMYRTVAANRGFFSFLTHLFPGREVAPPTYALVRWIFLRGLGGVYLIAFLSLGSQLLGLVGSDGIVPTAAFMESAQAKTAGLGLERFHQVPTLCWLSTSDNFLRGQCIAGVALSALLILGITPAVCLAGLWILYLSLTTVCTVFLGYQWDNLLLEAGFLAIFFAPVRFWPALHREAPPSRAVLWLLRWLLFRLVWSSGCVKLLSGDPTWRNLTALEYHYETQPLPTPLAWYAFQLPAWFQKLSCAVVLGVELVVPFFLFLPRRIRLVGFWVLVCLQLLIAATGNFAFFNLLTLMLCVLLLDDAAIQRFVPAGWQEWLGARPVTLWTRFAALRHACFGFVTALAVILLPLTALELAGMFRVTGSWAEPLIRAYAWAAPFRSVNNYGLFAVMTTTRPEIIVEGSADGRNWLPYEFKYKPGAPGGAPPWVAPHQPRLDWQMWFAALGDVRQNPWFVLFCYRLLENRPDVLALLAKNPFPVQPPKFIRASLYQYRFTDFATRRKTGAWWQREYRGEYCPPLSLSAQ